MTYYAATIYASRALLEAAVEALADTVTYKVVTYSDGNTAKFMLIVPAPNKTA